MLNATDLNVFLERALSAAKAAGELVLKWSREGSYQTNLKRGAELVTTADLKSDELIRSRLGAKFANHRFFSEEHTAEEKADFAGGVWIIDPLDGTVNYTHGHPYVSISIALAFDGEPRVGVVHAPFLNETFTAISGSGAKLNGSAIRVSQASDIRKALVGTGFPHDRSRLVWPMERVRRLVASCQDIRRTASPALDICYVAAGRLDAHCESLAPWDIAAAGLIATEAGALRTNLVAGNQSLPPRLRGEEFVVVAPGIFKQLCELIKS